MQFSVMQETAGDVTIEQRYVQHTINTFHSTPHPAGKQRAVLREVRIVGDMQVQHHYGMFVYYACATISTRLSIVFFLDGSYTKWFRFRYRAYWYT